VSYVKMEVVCRHQTSRRRHHNLCCFVVLRSTWVRRSWYHVG